MRSRTLWGLEESPPETLLPSPAEGADQPTTHHRERQDTFQPISLELGLQEEPSLFQHSKPCHASSPYQH